MRLTLSVVRSFNKQFKLHINEWTFNQDITNINYTLHPVSDQLTIELAKLRFLDIRETLMKSFIFLKDLDELLNSTTFPHYKIIRRSII